MNHQANGCGRVIANNSSEIIAVTVDGSDLRLDETKRGAVDVDDQCRPPDCRHPSFYSRLNQLASAGSRVRTLVHSRLRNRAT